MKRTVARSIITIAAVAATASLTLAQGVYSESTFEGGPGGKPMVSKTAIMPKMSWSESPDGKISIVKADKETFTQIDPATKTYSVMTFAEMEAKMKAMANDPKVAELKEKMKTMPEAQRKMMEGMLATMEGGKNSNVEVKSTGETKKILSYTCTKYIATSGGNEILTAWVTKEFKAFETVRKDWEATSIRMMKAAPGNAGAMGEAMMKMGGYPMEIDIMGMAIVVTKLEARSTPASQFEVPAGYTKVDAEKK